MEIGRLTAVFDADYSRFDRGSRHVEAKVTGLTNVLKSLGSTSVAIQGPLGGVAGRLQGISALSSQATSGLGAVGVGMAVVTAVTVGLGVALFGLVKQSAEAGGELLDLSQKTGFTVETLSTLSIVARTTGSDIGSLSASLVIFQKNQEAANNGSKEQSKLFKSLNIDTRDNEKATRQAFTALFKMSEGTHQTATAMKLFGRSGKDVLAIIKETNGDLDAATKKYDKMGLVISTSAATASDRFNDVLEETTLQLSAVTRSIGMELLPVATGALQDISSWLAINKSAWSSWGTGIADVLRGVSSIAQSEIGTMIGWIARLSAEMSGLPGLIRGIGALGASDRPVEDIWGPGGAMRGGRKTLPGTPEYLAAQRRLEGLGNTRTGGGGGGGRRGGGGSARQDPGVQLLKQLEEQFKELTPRTEAQRVADKLLDDQYKKTLDTIKKKIQITAMDIDSQKKILEVTRERFATEASYARLTEEEFIKSLSRARRFFALERERFMTKEGQNRPAWMDLGGGSTLGGEPGTTSRPRIATVDEQVARERIAKIREQMDVLAGDLTSIFSRSISDGFNQGIKSGLQTLAQGLLQIVQEIFLKRLAAGLSELLGGFATSGGWLQKALGFAIGVAGGSISLGGGSSFTPGGTGAVRPRIVGRASGGPVSPMSSYMVGEQGPEMFTPNVPGNIIPNGRMGQAVIHNHYTINLPPAPNTSYNPRRSARQQADMILAALQGA